MRLIAAALSKANPGLVIPLTLSFGSQKALRLGAEARSPMSTRNDVVGMRCTGKQISWRKAKDLPHSTSIVNSLSGPHEYSIASEGFDQLVVLQKIALNPLSLLSVFPLDFRTSADPNNVIDMSGLQQFQSLSPLHLRVNGLPHTQTGVW